VGAAAVGSSLEHMSIQLINDLSCVRRAWLLGGRDGGRERHCEDEHHCTVHDGTSCSPLLSQYACRKIADEHRFQRHDDNRGSPVGWPIRRQPESDQRALGYPERHGGKRRVVRERNNTGATIARPRFP
jgi:hypothetical protein